MVKLYMLYKRSDKARGGASPAQLKYFVMNNRSMEPVAVWMPCDLQLDNWTMDPAVCAPGHSIGYASTQLFGSCHQLSVPICEGGQQCEHEVATQYDPIETAKQEFTVDIQNMKMIISQNPVLVFKEVADECKDDVANTGMKMYRYPASIRALCLDERYTTPTVVAVGPYYHGRDDLKQVEKLKYVAAYQCIRDSGYSVKDMYDEVVPVAHDARRLYDKDVVARIGYDDFLHMMFFDACFLVQYMLAMSYSYDSADMEESLSSFFDANDNEIFHDIMLLENQIPWPVVETVMKFNFRRVPTREFVSSLVDCLQDRKSRKEKPFLMDQSYQPPHLLGLLRFYIVGRSKTEPVTQTEEISLSVSANELAEIGIDLKANENTQLIHMGIETNWPLFGKLFLAPLSLDDARASCLVSMAALELCTTSNFGNAEDEESAVCSYLVLLAMLVAREEDVQKLRTQHILLGGGVSNREVLDLFTRLKGLRLGSCYARTMIQIEHYRNKRRTRTKLYQCYCRNKDTIAKVGSAIVGVGSIIGTIITTTKRLWSP